MIVQNGGNRDDIEKSEVKWMILTLLSMTNNSP